VHYSCDANLSYTKLSYVKLNLNIFVIVGWLIVFVFVGSVLVLVYF